VDNVYGSAAEWDARKREYGSSYSMLEKLITSSGVKWQDYCATYVLTAYTTAYAVDGSLRPEFQRLANSLFVFLAMAHPCSGDISLCERLTLAGLYRDVKCSLPIAFVTRYSRSASSRYAAFNGAKTPTSQGWSL
jgi:hypothetical protein